jgi:hypothetical protein
MPHYSFEIHDKILYKKQTKLLVHLLKKINIKLSPDIILLIVKYTSNVSLDEYRMEAYLY